MLRAERGRRDRDALVCGSCHGPLAIRVGRDRVGRDRVVLDPGWRRADAPPDDYDVECWTMPKHAARRLAMTGKARNRRGVASMTVNAVSGAVVKRVDQRAIIRDAHELPIAITCPTCERWNTVHAAL
jgi:hypothetical protein